MTAIQINDVLKKQIGNTPNNSESERSDAKIARLQAEDRARENRQKAGELWKRANVPLRHQKPPAVAADNAWPEKLKVCQVKIGTGFLIAMIGQRGSGKTQMAVELIRGACFKLRSALYETAPEIFISLHDAQRLDESEAAVIQRFKNPQLLVIDEIQERGNTAWEDRLLTHIVDARYADMKDTVLISNQCRQDFEASMGSSIISRMIETGGIIECNWQSFRGPSA